MTSRLSTILILAILLNVTIQNFAQVARPETTQPFLTEMPTTDRVVREIQGSDPADTAARQMGAFKQLRKIIEELAWNLDHRYQTRLTPAETQIKNAYEEAYARVWRAGPDKSADNMRGFDRDLQFREELLNKFFSTNFRSKFKQSFVDDQARRKAKEQAEEQAEVKQVNDLKSQLRAEQRGSTNPGRLFAMRCAESGREKARCFAEAVGGDIKEAWLDPVFGNLSPEAGLHMNGIYPRKDFGLAFGNGMGQYSVSVKCADLVPENRDYQVALKNGQVVITISNENGPFSFVLTPAGNLVGSGSVVINGNIIAGYAKQWVEKRTVPDNQVVPGSGHYESVPIFKPKTARCVLGTLTPSLDRGGEDPSGLFSAITALMGTNADMTPGLRLVGIFDGGQGANMEFHPDTGTVGCREVALAHKYTITIKGGELAVNLQNPDATTFTYLADGTLRGPGTVSVNGRRAISGDGPPASTNVNLYMNWSDTCNYGVLTPLKGGTRLDLSPLALTPPPKQTTGPANAVLTISSGFPENGPEAILRDHSVLLLTDNFESILWDAGFPPSPAKGTPAIAFWGQACETASPLCLQGARETNKSKAGSVKLDKSGQGSFAAVPAGTYYLLTQTAYNKRHYLWNYRIDLQPGQNSLTLTHANATFK